MHTKKSRTYHVDNEPHDVLFAAHPGFTEVFKDITKLQYWPKMRKGIEK